MKKAKLKNFGPNADKLEVNIPELPFPYPELRPYQKELFDKIMDKKYKFQPITRFNKIPTYTGIDFGTADGDRTVLAHAKLGKNGITEIWFDEYSNWMKYKWYRNPIKWYKLRKVMKIVEKNYERLPSNNS